MYGLQLRSAIALWLMVSCSTTQASFVVDYTIDVGGKNTSGSTGLSARSTWVIDGNQLSILLENTSTALPAGFGTADSLLVSLAFNLDNQSIVSGNTAEIGLGSIGLGDWSALAAGDSVADQWLWTNGSGGDLLTDFTQIISTSMGQNNSSHLDFNGLPASVDGPFGGIAAAPPLLAISGNQQAVSSSIVFNVTLSGTLSEGQLEAIATSSWVEFGSDFQYLAVPGPGTLPILMTLSMVFRSRRRQ